MFETSYKGAKMMASFRDPWGPSPSRSPPFFTENQEEATDDEEEVTDDEGGLTDYW